MKKPYSNIAPGSASPGVSSTGHDVLPITIAGIELDYIAQSALRLGRKLRIGVIEFQLLSLLLTFPGRIFSREELISLLWREDASVGPRNIDVRIGRLRKALTVGGAPDPIHSIWGRGYKLNEQCEQEFRAWLAGRKKKLRLNR